MNGATEIDIFDYYSRQKVGAYWAYIKPSIGEYISTDGQRVSKVMEIIHVIGKRPDVKLQIYVTDRGINTTG